VTPMIIAVGYLPCDLNEPQLIARGAGRMNSLPGNFPP
jgi:hypothetical protein